MKAIQTYLPNPRHTETKRIFVKVKPGVAWKLARHYDMSSVPWVRFLFNLRTVTDLFHEERPRFGDKKIGFIDEIEENGKGFLVLHETPGKEVVVGAVGKFWHIDIPFVEIKPQEYRDFNEAGWGKVAWSITVEPYLGGSTICFELRTSATDDESWKKLNRYYHVIGAFSKLIRHTLMERLEKELGSLVLPAEDTRSLAGDEIIPDTKFVDTDHINIEAPVSFVWPYLMQLGCDRAGWYSIDWLDNGGVRSTDHLVGDWSDRKVGDKLSATPKKDSFFEVYQIEHEKYFVIGGELKTEEGFFKSSWSFVLEPVGEEASHLVVRAKMTMSPKWKEWFMGNLFYPPVHGIMEAVQLKTIKRYAERDAEARIETDVAKEVAEV
ncbi:hypothetical protein [Segetibacter koreensis]|uniref:hypothetical protein n=1 Tax=Segetibacter koreensis TaxID=398037 RepID=UPI00035EE1E6|nr:hypothetical protein [Segetibacter koreensis]